ncbi:MULTISPECIES: hypothetical protein [Methylobacterium]|uniref:hypothetical protein n=1 Tax=Methylobacterium TaxID=407 RepID=UPI00272E9941|nr:hypothetical protein [Methylobacterium sp.]
MDTQQLLHALATVPGTPGQHITRRMAVNMIAAGRAIAGGALVELIGPEVIPVLVAACAPAPALRSAIDTALLVRHREMPAFLASSGGRPEFANWYRRAEYTLPAEMPEIVDIYRGSMGCSPAAAATGLHWSLNSDDAAYYACRFADAAMTGVIVVHARVPRDGIACIVSGCAHSELVPVEAPTSFEVITDHQRIGDAAERRHHQLAAMKAAGGWFETITTGMAGAAAKANRARMAAAGVAPGTAIVA